MSIEVGTRVSFVGEGDSGNGTVGLVSPDDSGVDLLFIRWDDGDSDGWFHPDDVAEL